MFNYIRYFRHTQRMRSQITGEIEDDDIVRQMNENIKFYEEFQFVV